LSFFISLPTHTQAFLGFIGLLTLFFHAKYSDKTIAYGPTILTTTGIFATFVAITIGLSHFKTDAIQESVPRYINFQKLYDKRVVDVSPDPNPLTSAHRWRR
jgi:hypothetical protein